VADIFLSYAQADADRAKRIAAALSAKGWSVWWDVSLVAGDRYRSKIAEQLRSAKCVVVLWSRHSIESDWVIDEAEDGKRRRVLAQALIEDVLPPHGFRQIQAARLIEWDGGDSGEFRRLCAGISVYARSSAPPEKAALTPAPGSVWFANSDWRWTVGKSIPELWMELERRFKKLDDSTLVATVELYAPEWRIWAQSKSAKSEEECRFLVECAGDLLTKSSQVWKEVIASSLVVIAATNSIDRWLRFLRRDRGGDVGAILDLAKASAEACAYCAAKEANR
jgi:hypothetical protein